MLSGRSIFVWIPLPLQAKTLSGQRVFNNAKRNDMAERRGSSCALMLGFVTPHWHSCLRTQPYHERICKEIYVTKKHCLFNFPEKDILPRQAFEECQAEERRCLHGQVGGLPDYRSSTLWKRGKVFCPTQFLKQKQLDGKRKGKRKKASYSLFRNREGTKNVIIFVRGASTLPFWIILNRTKDPDQLRKQYSLFLLTSRSP